MALTRKMLKAMGIEDEKADEIIEAHAETVEALKAKAQEAGDGAGKAEELAKQVDQLKKELEEAQKAGDPGDPDGLKAKYDKEHEAFEAYKADVSAKEADRTKKGLYRKLLEDAGVDPKRIDSVLRVSDLSKVSVKDGAIEGAEGIEEGIRKDWADFIPSVHQQGSNPPTPPAGGEAEPDFSKMSAADYIAWKHQKK